MFLTDTDYRVVCDDEELDILAQSSADIRAQAERVAIEEAAGYLRSKYDTDAAFSARGGGRNHMLVQVVANIALYYLAHWLPGGMTLDRRQVLYEQATEWLARVSRGAVMPDLPVYTDPDGGAAPSGPVRFGGMAPSKYDY